MDINVSRLGGARGGGEGHIRSIRGTGRLWHAWAVAVAVVVVGVHHLPLAVASGERDLNRGEVVLRV